MFTIISKEQARDSRIINASCTKPRKVNYFSEKELPAFIQHNSGWLRAYQSWSKKSHQHSSKRFLSQLHKYVSLNVWIGQQNTAI